MPRQCNVRRIATNVIVGAAAVCLIVVFTGQARLQRNFSAIVEASAMSSRHPGELQLQLQQQYVHLPPAMLPSETLKFQQKCWKANYSSSDKTPVDHTPLPFLLAPSETSGPSCRGDIFLLVMVQSAVPNRDRRDLIRRTWASVTNIKGDRLRTVFIVGRTYSSSETVALRKESNSEADIVQGDFIDTYRNLTYKHLYALKWIGQRCESVRYVMKVDDKSVINVFQLRLALIEQLASVKGDFFYCQTVSVKPIRNLDSEWGVTKEEWPSDEYPEYCLGYGYVMTGSLVAQLHHCAKWRRYFRIHDVFVSGDLASALGAQRIRWEDGWGAKFMHPRLVGPEAAQLVLAYEPGYSVLPTLHTRVWQAMVRYSGEFGYEL